MGMNKIESWREWKLRWWPISVFNSSAVFGPASATPACEAAFALALHLAFALALAFAAPQLGPAVAKDIYKSLGVSTSYLN